MNKLVSIITPCYNGEKYVSRFLDSILNQTYKNIELIFVNDGSTDKTEEIVLEYLPAFRQEGMKLIYKRQANAGQAAALNKGLKWFSGEFLTWPDSDDYLDPLSIEKRVDFLEYNPDYGLVRSNAYYVDFYTLKNVRKLAVLPRRYESRLFEGLIKGIQYWVNGCYLVRTTAFLDVNPERSIEYSFVGQNVQMLLPVSYKYRCGYIDECLFYYVNTPGSHSRVKRTYRQAYERCDEFYRLLRSVCNGITMSETDRNKYAGQLEEYRMLAHRDLALQYKQRGDFGKYEMSLQRNHGKYSCIPVLWIYFFKRWERVLKMESKNLIKRFVR